MTRPSLPERLDLRYPPQVEALAGMRPPGRAATWTRGRAVAALLLAGPLFLALLDALPALHPPTTTELVLLAVAASGSAATLATYLPRSWPPAGLRPTAPCAAGPVVLLALAWLMTGIALSAAALVPVAVLGVVALGQRLLTAATCGPRR